MKGVTKVLFSVFYWKHKILAWIKSALERRAKLKTSQHLQDIFCKKILSKSQICELQGNL